MLLPSPSSSHGAYRFCSLFFFINRYLSVLRLGVHPLPCPVCTGLNMGQGSHRLWASPRPQSSPPLLPVLQAHGARGKGGHCLPGMSPGWDHSAVGQEGRPYSCVGRPRGTVYPSLPSQVCAGREDCHPRQGNKYCTDRTDVTSGLEQGFVTRYPSVSCRT